MRVINFILWVVVLNITFFKNSSVYAESPCQTVKAIIDEAFQSFLSDQVRGMNCIYARSIFRTSVHTLFSIITVKRPNVPNVGKVCLTPAERIEIASSTNAKDTQIWVPHAKAFQSIPGSLNGSRSAQRSLEGEESMSQDETASRDSTASVMLGVRRARATLSAIHAIVTEPRRSQSVLISPEDINIMTRAVTATSILSRNIFYIPLSHATEAHVIQLEAVMKRADIIAMRNAIHVHLQNPPSMQLAGKLILLPDTVSVVYDPNQKIIADAFDKKVNVTDAFNIPNQNMSAQELLYNVSSMVLWMHDKGVAQNKTIKLLQHVAAFLFNGMRGKQRKAKYFRVSGIFLPFYYQRFREWTKEASKGPPPCFHHDDVARIYRSVLEPLLDFSSAGQLDTLWMMPLENKIYYVDFAAKFFGPALLSKLKSLHEWRQLGSTLTEYHDTIIRSTLEFIRWTTSIHKKIFSSFPGAIVEDGSSNPRYSKSTVLQEYCDTTPGFVFFENREYQYDDQNCCAIPCGIAEFSNGVEVSMENCCKSCNLFRCHFQEVDWLEKVMTVLVESYGWYGDYVASRVII